MEVEAEAHASRSIRLQPPRPLAFRTRSRENNNVHGRVPPRRLVIICEGAFWDVALFKSWPSFFHPRLCLALFGGIRSRWVVINDKS